MPREQTIVFETKRLRVRVATPADIDHYLALWGNPRVMVHVGFPRGLPVDRDELLEKLADQGSEVFNTRLVVENRENGAALGECKLARPDEAGIAEPDIKLLPQYWGQGYGRELWGAILAYQFEHTDCQAVQTTPNVNNQAAVRLYESSGALREGESVYHFPESMRDYTTPVHAYIYRLHRKTWEATQAGHPQ